MTIPLYVGYDHRESVGFHVLQHSIIENTNAEVSFTPITGRDQRDATNLFSYERWGIPRRQGYRGWAIYAESDMLCMADIEALYELREEHFDVMVAKHDYKTKFTVKYWRQQNRDYPRKNWSSFMLINCAAAIWQRLDEVRPKMTGADLHRFSLFDEERIGALPLEWNWLVGEYDRNPNAHLLHYTIGIPPLYPGLDHEEEWWDAWQRMQAGAMKTSRSAR